MCVQLFFAFMCSTFCFVAGPRRFLFLPRENASAVFIRWVFFPERTSQNMSLDGIHFFAASKSLVVLLHAASEPRAHFRTKLFWAGFQEHALITEAPYHDNRSKMPFQCFVVTQIQRKKGSWARRKISGIQKCPSVVCRVKVALLGAFQWFLTGAILIFVSSRALISGKNRTYY